MKYKIYGILIGALTIGGCGSSKPQPELFKLDTSNLNSSSSSSSNSASSSTSSSSSASSSSSTSSSSSSSSSTSSSSSSGSVTVQPRSGDDAVSSNVVWAINAGGPTLASNANVIYNKDAHFVSGASGDTTDPIDNTTNTPLFQSERWGKAFSYEFPVTEGRYDVTLHMLELWFTDNDERVQNVFIEGEQVLENFDIHAYAGHDVAVSFSYAGFDVSDGYLTVEFEGITDAGNVAGILVTSETGAPVLPEDIPPPETTTELIKLNQLGFTPSATKIAIIPNVTATEFEVRDTATDTVVYTGSLSDGEYWDAAGEIVKRADFSAFSTAGSYTISVAGVTRSNTFDISDVIYSDVHDAALKAYYYNRASTELEETHAGTWARAAGHPDTTVYVHESAATVATPENTIFSAPKGWYDAGDYNKYVVNAGISTYTLLAAYEHFDAFYANRDINIPESGDAVPDILDEIMWNLDWLENMQDPADGAVFHKLTTEGFSALVMPHQTNATRYMAAKGTAATLDFAAVMAVASRILKDFDTAKAARYATAAENAWAWANANPSVTYTNSGGIRTGEYGDSYLQDEFAWAAAELFILTEDRAYYDAFIDRNQALNIPWWGGVSSLGYVSLLEHGESLLTQQEYQGIQNAFTQLANGLAVKQQANPYRVPMEENDFGWGSNSATLNQAFIAYQAYRINGDVAYFEVATSAMDYVLGRNATDYSFVTGYGDKSANDPHHRPSEADGIVDAVPGFVVGGPNSAAPTQDGCSYSASSPAKVYLDSKCSYATNEVTINWNAPLVYILAALQQ